MWSNNYKCLENIILSLIWRISTSPRSGCKSIWHRRSGGVPTTLLPPNAFKRGWNGKTLTCINKTRNYDLWHYGEPTSNPSTYYSYAWRLDFMPCLCYAPTIGGILFLYMLYNDNWMQSLLDNKMEWDLASFRSRVAKISRRSRWHQASVQRTCSIMRIWFKNIPSWFYLSIENHEEINF